MGLGDHTRNVGYKMGSFTYEFEIKTFSYDCGIKLHTVVIDMEASCVLA